MDTLHFLTGLKLRRNQIIAMVLKRSLSTYRSIILFLIQIFIPVMFIVMAMLVARNTDANKDLPNLPITLDTYENPVTVVNGTPSNPYYNHYVDLIKTENKAVVNLHDEDLGDMIADKVNAEFIRLQLQLARFCVWFLTPITMPKYAI